MDRDFFAIHVGHDEEGYFADVAGKIVEKDVDREVFYVKLAMWCFKRALPPQKKQRRQKRNKK
jgi:hypothetical protein